MVILTSHTAEILFGRSAIVLSFAFHYFGMVTAHGQLVRWFSW